MPPGLGFHLAEVPHPQSGSPVVSMTPFKHDMMSGGSAPDLIMSTWQGNAILTPYLMSIPKNQYKFLWLDGCCTAGSSQFQGSNDYMTSSPVPTWGTSFGMSVWKENQGFLGWNGSSLSNGSRSLVGNVAETCWKRWRLRLWRALLISDLTLTDAVNDANLHMGASDTRYMPYTTENGVSKVYWLGGFSFP